MPIDFVKFHGTGNDFILVDDRSLSFPHNNQKLVQNLCDRHFGIGADGLMLIRGIDSGNKASSSETVDFEMLYFNADGRIGSLCGNGGRCAVRYAHELGLCSEQTIFSAADGLHHADILPDGRISLGMATVADWGRDEGAWVLDTGSPHWVCFTNQTAELDMVSEGRKVRFSAPYASNGINVNFAGPGSGKAEDPLFIRTYERGVENETLACGTGATAIALALALESDLQGEQSIWLRSLGGMLEVRFDRKDQRFENIRLIGPAQRVFRGIWNTDDEVGA